MKNVPEQMRQKSRPALEMLEKMSEESIQEKQDADGMLTKKGAIIATMKNKYGGNEQETEAVFENCTGTSGSSPALKPKERLRKGWKDANKEEERVHTLGSTCGSPEPPPKVAGGQGS